MTLGEIIKQYRNEHEMSMDDFAKVSGLSKGYISMLEKNINPSTNRPIAPSVEKLNQVANVLAVSFNDLMDMLDDNQKISLQDVGTDTENSKVMTMRKMFSDKLKHLRNEKKISMCQMAKELNIPYTTYANYEKNKKEPSSKILIQLAKYFKVSIDYLLGLEDEKTDKDVQTTSNISFTSDEQTVLELYKQLDANDKGEIKGEMKQMLKADKYKSDMVQIRLLARGGEYIEEVNRQDLIEALEKDRNNKEPIPDDIF